VRFCREKLGLPGHNALRDGEELAETVLAAIAARGERLERNLAAVS
jgi:hypothetical protein